MASTVLLIYAWGDFNSRSVIGVAVTKEIAISLMTKAANEHTYEGKKITVFETSNNEFRKSNSTSDPSEHDYWIEEAKLNTLLH